MKDFRLPDPGEGLVEADIVTWRVAEGDQVKVNDIVVEVETSKSLVELPIPFAGTVAKLLVAEGDTVDVGAPIITIDDGTGAPSGARPEHRRKSLVPDVPAESSSTAEENPSGRVAVLVGYGTADDRGETPSTQGCGGSTGRDRRQSERRRRILRHRPSRRLPSGRTPSAHARPRRAGRRAAAQPGRHAGPGFGAARHDPGAGQATGSQAGQGSGRRSDDADRQR